MNWVIAALLAWLGLSVLVLLFALRHPDKSGRADELDFHERMDLR